METSQHEKRSYAKFLCELIKNSLLLSQSLMKWVVEDSMLSNPKWSAWEMSLVEFILGPWKQLMVHLLWSFDHITWLLGFGLVGPPLLSRLKCFDNYWGLVIKFNNTHLWSPEDKSYQLWWSSDFSSITYRLKFPLSWEMFKILLDGVRRCTLTFPLVSSLGSEVVV